MNNEEVNENKRISTIKQQVLNPKSPGSTMMTGAKKVGMTNQLIIQKEFKSKEEWEKFYYNSGKERLDKINGFIKEKEAELKERGSKRTKVPESWVAEFIKENNLLEEYGRTEEELNYLGKDLFETIPKKIIPKYEELKSVAENISLKDCQDFIKEVVIDNTWVGEVKRGNNVIKNLKKGGIGGFEKTSGDVDSKMAVDYEMKLPKGNIGLQIKPEGHEPKIAQSNSRAQEKFMGRVFTIKADKDGNIQNQIKILEDIKEEIKRLS